MLVGLATGEQVMGKISDDFWSDHYISIKNPAVIVNTEKGLGIAPWLMYTTAHTEPMKINKDNVIWVADLPSDIVNQYNTQYGNGLVLPSKEVQAPPAPELVMST